MVKRLAAEHGLDLSAIAGSGPGGRIVKDDIMPYVTGAKPAPVAAQPAPQAAPAAAPQGTVAATPGAPGGVARDMSRIRRTTGRRMLESKQTIPHFYVSTVVDMDAAAQFREQVNAQAKDEESKVSFNDLIVKACALALREFPNLNTSLEGDTLYDHANIDINIAVAIEGGLIAPFVRDADSKSLGAIARTAKDIINRARNGGLEPAEYQGGTFTISNLGMYDVDEFIAIINPPQAAILAIGSITETAVVKDGRVSAGKRMKIALSADHRVTDGAEVAKFLIAVKGYLQNPMQLAVS
jgi:pyruvate dehydrogenase E2 component (dihydrolipoamide acetyltransferase)